MYTSKKLYNPILIISLFIICLVTLLSSIFPIYLNGFFDMLQEWFAIHLGWIYILFVGGILLFSIYLCFSRLGEIKLGQDHERPEFKNLSWFSMLFSAGMGTGLVFWGVAEPIIHFSYPPVGEAYSLISAQAAMQITFFHWGVHAWAVYSLIAIAMAYFSYRKDLPLLPRSIFYPLLRDRVFGMIGHIIDIFTIVSTVFGISTSLGLGVTQINSGLHYLFELDEGVEVQIVLILCITSLSILSVVLGIDKGIKILSNVNVILAVFFMSFILFLGDTIMLLQSFVQNTGAYLSDLMYKTFNLYAYERRESWIGGWTLLYWSWWISWSPFVGMFIARISKGRTIREFMLGVLFVPTIFTFIWMTIFGNSAISLILSDNGTELLKVVNSNVSIVLFKFLEYFPFSSGLCLFVLLLIGTFFVSSADSGALVVSTLSSEGNEKPSIGQKVLWSSLIAVVASILLYSGGMKALQTMTILSAMPVLLIIIVGSYCLTSSLREDLLLQRSVQYHNTVLQYSNTFSSWQERLKSLVMHPQKIEVSKFMNNIVVPALNEISMEMKNLGINVSLKIKSSVSVVLYVVKDDAVDFLYEVSLRKYKVPEYAVVKNEKFCRAEVFLLNGGQGYDVFGYTKQQIIADVVTQYEKHIHYLQQSLEI